MKSIVVAALIAAAVLAGCGGASDESAGGGGHGGASSGSTAQAELPFSTVGWRTDFAKHSVPLDQFASGGPGKDGIPAIDHPRFVDLDTADRFLVGDEPVAVVELDDAVKAYPIQIMVWHEIVNDTLAGHPIALTYCPLCNSTVAFSRRVDGQTLSFGTTGNLRNSDLVMYDRQTESWWQQLTAEAVIGKLTGARLKVLPSQILSWSQFKRLHPDGRVLSRNTGYERPYGQNPYAGYDQPNSPPFALSGQPDPKLPPKERVAAVQTGHRSAVVYPFSRLERDVPLNDRIDGRPVVVFFDPRVGSPLDAPEVSLGRNVGAAAVFSRHLDGRTLAFEQGDAPGTFRDRPTGSTWDMSGRATAGPLHGKCLEQIPSDDQFWFALAAFFPHADLRG